MGYIEQIKITRGKHRASAGFSLLEVLIALVVLSVGLLGVAALISTALKSNDSAYMRTQATALAYNIIDRMRANLPAANNFAYNVAMPASATTANTSACTGANCTSAQLAAYDIAQWEYDLGTQLPQGRGAVAATTASGILNVTVTVLWNETRANGSLERSGAPAAGTNFTLSVSSALQ